MCSFLAKIIWQIFGKFKNLPKNIENSNNLPIKIIWLKKKFLNFLSPIHYFGGYYG